MDLMNKKISSSVQIYALGGLGEVGKNTYCVENDNSILIIDAGIKFPEEDYPGVDYVIPDYSHLKENQSKIKALIITHGHEDHIGAIPFLLMQINIPVIYASKLAMALINNKLEDHHLTRLVKVVEYNDDTIIHTGDFSIEFFHVTHSIPDSFGLFITTPQGTILHTGDFKFDLTPVDRDFDIGKLSKFAERGIDLLLADSTNADKEGYTQSEKSVINSINDVFRHAQGRLIVSTFSSNLSRIQQIIDAAVRFERKICIFGRSMEANVHSAMSFGYIKTPRGSIVSPDKIKGLKNSEVLILCTGSQGEPMAALSRIASGEHRQIKILPGDTVVFSSSPIPGNSVSINKVVNQLIKCGADVLVNSVFYNLHASGHPCKQELRLLQKITHPAYFMPVHGEFHMLKQHAEVAIEVGMKRENTFILSNGESLKLMNHHIVEGNPVKADSIYIDGNNVNGVSNSIINDRKHIAHSGLFTVLIGIDANKCIVSFKPKIKSYGVIFPNNKKGVIAKIPDVIEAELNKRLQPNYKKEHVQEICRIIVNQACLREKIRQPAVIANVLYLK